MVNRRNNIVLVKRDVPKRVTLPNGRTFMAKYRRVNRHYLPGGITIARTYRGQPARGRRPPAVRAPPAAQPAAPAVVRLPGVARAVAGAGNRRAARGNAVARARNRGTARKRAARGAAWHRGLRQGGKGLGDIVKAVANNPYAQEVGKRLLTKGINYIPTLLFKKGTRKIKNKHLRKMPQSDIVADLVDEGTKRLHGGIGL